MNAIKAIETIDSWRRIVVEGKPSQLDLLLQMSSKSSMTKAGVGGSTSKQKWRDRQMR